jgi:hypothetical protein
LAAGGSSGEERKLLLVGNPTFYPKIAMGNCFFCGSERMRNYAKEKTRITGEYMQLRHISK